MKNAKKQPSPPRESEIQAQIVGILSFYARKNHFIFFSVPNERDLSGAVNRFALMANLKKMGFTPGVADLCIVKQGKAYFLEVKTPTGVVSDNQRIFMNAAANAGAHYAVVRSYEEAVAVLKQWEIFS